MLLAMVVAQQLGQSADLRSNDDVCRRTDALHSLHVGRHGNQYVYHGVVLMIGW